MGVWRDGDGDLEGMGILGGWEWGRGMGIGGMRMGKRDGDGEEGWGWGICRYIWECVMGMG